jgi:hypothetical protein
VLRARSMRDCAIVARTSERVMFAIHLSPTVRCQTQRPPRGWRFQPMFHLCGASSLDDGRRQDSDKVRAAPLENTAWAGRCRQTTKSPTSRYCFG